MAYLVDTNIMVDFTRGNRKAADYPDSLGDACLLSAITALERYRCHDLGVRADRADSRYRSLITATAIEEGLTLATKNRKHFQMIGDVKLEAPNC